MELEKLSAKNVVSPEKKIYRAIINQSPVGISVRDRNGNLFVYD
jgi:PAS domain-containing protein